MARGPPPVPDEHRCRRSDGRQWRCPRSAMAGVSFCEHHYHLARRNQAKHKGLLDSPPTPRRKPGRPSRSRLEPLDPPLRKRRRKGDPPTEELIAVALRRQMERTEEREKKREEAEGRTEVTRDLPNGVMTISLTSARVPGNAGQPSDRKLGFDQGPFFRRCIRSKNAEPLPVGPLKKFPCGKGLRRGRKRICHRCGESKAAHMVRCSSCLKESFCSSCIKKWYSEMSEAEVKLSCPICRGYCNCKTCMLTGAKAGGCKKFSTGQTNFIQIKYAYYLIDQLLPVLKQISQEQITELEIEAHSQGRRLSGAQIQVVERGPDELLHCNNCKNSIVDFLRSCSKCPYRLCLSCCQEIRGGNLKVAVSTFKYRNKRKAYKHAGKALHGLKQKLSIRMHPDISSLSPKLLLPEWKSENNEGSISCPSKEFGGCGDGLMNLVFKLPFNWSEELNLNAVQLAPGYKYPEKLEVSSHCS